MIKNLKVLIRNSVIRILVAFLAYIFCGNSFALALRKKEVVLDQEFWSTIGRLSADRRVKIYKNQSFTVDKFNVDFFAGTIIGGPAPVKLDCFVYVKSRNGKGKAFFASTKADQLWRCIGLPTLSAKQVKGVDVDLLIFSTFIYQAPSGEFFKLSFIIESKKSNGFEVGQVDECVTAKAQNMELKKIVQLHKLADECVVP